MPTRHYMDCWQNRVQQALCDYSGLYLLTRLTVTQISGGKQIFRNVDDVNDSISKLLTSYLSLCEHRDHHAKLICRQWILQPLMDVTEIRRRQNYVELLVEDTQL